MNSSEVTFFKYCKTHLRGMQSYCLLFSAIFILADWRRYLSAPKRKHFSSKILSSPPKTNIFYHSYLEYSLFVCSRQDMQSYQKQQYWIRTHDRGWEQWVYSRHTLVLQNYFKNGNSKWEVQHTKPIFRILFSVSLEPSSRCKQVLLEPSFHYDFDGIYYNDGMYNDGIYYNVWYASVACWYVIKLKSGQRVGLQLVDSQSTVGGRVDRRVGGIGFFTFTH